MIIALDTSEKKARILEDIRAASIDGVVSRARYEEYRLNSGRDDVASYSMICRIFGKWMNAVREAGVETTREHDNRVVGGLFNRRSMAIASLTWFARENPGQRATRKAYQEWSRHKEGALTSTYIINIMGSWNNALSAADLIVNRETPSDKSEMTDYSDDDLRGYLRQALDDGATTRRKYEEWRRIDHPEAPSFGTVVNRYGSWSLAKRLFDESTNEE